MLLTPEQVQFGAYSLFSGRTVLAPATDARLDQVGLAEIAWSTFAVAGTGSGGFGGGSAQRIRDGSVGCADGPFLGAAQPGAHLHPHGIAAFTGASRSRSSA